MRTPRKDDKVFIKSNLQLNRESGCKPSKVESYVLGIAFVRPYRSRELLEISPNDLDYCCDEVLTSEEKRKLITDYVKIERLKTPKDWNIEIGFVNKLEKMYPHVDFWRNFHITYKVQSFCFFIGGGKEQIATMYKKFLFDNQLTKEQNSLRLASDKIGTDVQIKKQLNLFD